MGPRGAGEEICRAPFVARVAPPQSGAPQPPAENAETLAGAVESVEEDRLALTTDEGTETVLVGEDTLLTLFLERSDQHLEEGASVTLMGQRDQQGEMRAAVLLLGDSGAGPGVFGGRVGPFGDGLLRTGEPPSAEDIAELERQLGAIAASEGVQIPPEARQRLRALAAQRGGTGTEPGQGAGFARRGAVSGTIAQVGDGSITIDTDRGPVDAVFDADTLIREVISDGKLADLPIGAQVTVLGNRAGDDAFRAAQVIMTPDFGEALSGLFAPGGPTQGNSTGP